MRKIKWLALGLMVLTSTLTAGGRVSAYYDTRENNTVNIQTASKNLPWDLEYWGFIDIDSNARQSSDRHDLTTFFIEQRLAWYSEQHWGIMAEYNDASGSGNELVRFGLAKKIIRPNIFLLLRGFPVETDGEGEQISVAWNVSLYKKKLFLEGFWDLNFIEGDTRQVTEPQLRWKFNDKVSALAEWRYNEFLEGSTKGSTGMAIGLGIEL